MTVLQCDQERLSVIWSMNRKLKYYVINEQKAIQAAYHTLWSWSCRTPICLTKWHVQGCFSSVFGKYLCLTVSVNRSHNNQGLVCAFVWNISRAMKPAVYFCHIIRLRVQFYTAVHLLMEEFLFLMVVSVNRIYKYEMKTARSHFKMPSVTPITDVAPRGVKIG